MERGGESGFMNSRHNFCIFSVFLLSVVFVADWFSVYL